MTGLSAARRLSAGIPKVTQDLTVKFRYNDLASLEALFRPVSGENSCVILEAETTVDRRHQGSCRVAGADTGKTGPSLSWMK